MKSEIEKLIEIEIGDRVGDGGGVERGNRISSSGGNKARGIQILGVNGNLVGQNAGQALEVSELDGKG